MVKTILILPILATLATANPANRETCLTEWIQKKMSTTPNHVLYKSVDARLELAAEIENAAARYPVAFPELILLYAYRESSFKIDAVGKIGEKGIMQFGQMTRAVCESHLKLDLTKRQDQLYCGAYWIQRLAERCGSLQSGLAAYNSKGGRCGGTPKGLRKAKSRLERAQKMKGHCNGTK